MSEYSWSHKLSSLEVLDSHGINTPKLLEAINSRAEIISKHARIKRLKTPIVSVRTERNGDFNCPHYPNYRVEYVPWDSLFHNRYHVLVFEAIDPQDCEVKGNCYMDRMGDRFIVEAKEGPGTVRGMKIPTTIKIPITQFVSSTHIVSSFDIMKVLENYMRIAKDFEGDIMEWSIYKNPVGKKQEKFIAWELRPWKS